MSERSEQPRDWSRLRRQIIGLGEESIRKNYYPQLQQRLRELEESEARFRAIYDSVNDAIFVHEIPTGSIIDANRRACELLGYTHAELCQGGLAAICGDAPYSVDDAVRLVQDTGRGIPRMIDWPLLRKDGSTVWVEVGLRTAVIGNRERALAVVRDITERMNAQRALAESEEHKRRFYRQTILSVTDGKLDICEALDAEPYITSASVHVDVRMASEAAAARHDIGAFLGLDADDMAVFIMAVGEAIMNAIQHAECGHVFAGKNDDEAWAGVTDEGSGIESLILPSAVLRRGFSTKQTMGLGYSIMLEAADRILLHTGKTGTSIILVKNLRKLPPDEALLDILAGLQS